MKRKIIISFILAAGLLFAITIVTNAWQVAASWGSLASVPPADAAVLPERNGAEGSYVTTTITYQGHLVEGGIPANGPYDFEFLAFDDPVAGNQLGMTMSVEEAGVVDGRFTAILDFGDIYTGQAIWLEIGVRPGNETGAYTTLSPRQALTGAPYALGLRPGTVISGQVPIFGQASLYLNNPIGDGLGIDYASGDGIEVHDVGENAVEISLAGLNGIRVDHAGSNGLYIYEALESGVLVNHAGDHGVYAKSNSGAHYGGYFINSATGGGGLYAEGGSTLTPDLVLGGSARGYLSSDPSDPTSNLRLVSNDDFLIWLDDDNDESGFFGIYNGANGLVFTVDESGNYSAAGTKSAVVEAGEYGRVKLYAMESPENWFEDFGAASLNAGEAVVTIEPLFAKTVNLEMDYHVFLTPLGDCALYVAEKSLASFTVRAQGGATCSIEFDYRIVAKRQGYEDLRLELAGFDQIAGEE